MDTIKQKWKNYTLQKRLQELWDDYKKVSHLEDDPETLQKFKVFLEQANLTVKNFVKNNEYSLESILGDANEMLESILEYLNKFHEISKRQTDQAQLVQDIMDQCVLLAEYILRDAKYRKSIEKTHNVLADFLNLVEKAQKSESKVIIVKLIVLFSETLNQRIEFFEQQGFHKLLQSLMTRDPQLSRVISKALLHFLSIEDLSAVSLEMDYEDPQEQSLKQKLSQIAFSFRKFAFQELSKVFLSTQQESLQQQIGMSAISEQQLVNSTINRIYTLQQAIELPITMQNIFQNDLSLSINMQTWSRSTSDQDDERSEILEKLIQDSGSPITQSQLSVGTDSEELIKEFQMLQGGFKAILEILITATGDVQFDLLLTVQQILTTKGRNKNEFRKVNGYQFLRQLIQSKDLHDEAFYKYFLEFLKQIIVLDNEIDDYDAFTLLMELLFLKQQHAFQYLSELLSINWQNVIIAQRLKLTFYLACMQLRQYYGSDEIQQLIVFDNEYLRNHFKGVLSNQTFQAFNQFDYNQLYTLYEKLNHLLGFYTLEFEAVQSQLALCLIGDPDKFQQIISFLFKVVQQKLDKKCRIINSFDHLSEVVFKNFALLFKHIYKQLIIAKQEKNENIQSQYVNFIQILEIINAFINCDHKEQQQDNQFIKILVSQNRCEQTVRMLQIQLQTIQLSQILELFEFDVTQQTDLATQHLRFKLNQVLFDSLSGIVNHSDIKVEPQMALYLSFAQYDMWQALDKQPSNPINQLFDFHIQLTIKNNAHPQYCVPIAMLLHKVQLSDENAIVIENLTALSRQFDLKHQDIVNSLMISISRNLHLYFELVNVYPASIQFIEAQLQKVDCEGWMDFIFSSETIRRASELQVGQAFSDLLSLLTIHSMFQGQLFDRMLTSEYLTNALSALTYDSTKEQGIKLAYICYLLNLKNKLKCPIYSIKQRYFQLIWKLIDQEQFSNQICNTVYKLIFWNFDSYHVLYTENSSTVSSVMVRSEFAEVIAKQQQLYLENKAQIQHINNIEILELFFQILSKNPQDAYIFEMLKIFESILDNHNLNILIESNVIQWLLKLQRQNEFGQKINGQIIIIIRVLITYDLQRPPKYSRIVELLKKYNSHDIIIDYFQQLKDNPIIKSDPSIFLKNFANLIQNLDELVGFSEEIDVLLLQVINLMASKNSPEVRTILKQLDYLDIRDTLAFQVLRYNIPPDEFMEILSGIPFQQICNQKQFKESHCLSYLLKRLMQHKDHFGLQMLIIKILKYDVSQVEDNRKYVSKILQNEQLIGFFYPTMVRKSSKSLKCFEQDDTRPHRSTSPDLDQLSSNTTVDQFLIHFFSPNLDDERKQIELFLQKLLIPVENDFKKHCQKLSAKKTIRLQKLEDPQEELKTQTIINEWELKIQQRLKRSLERYRSRNQRVTEQFDQLLADGENQWFSICVKTS